jgi:hypothetical protein
MSAGSPPTASKTLLTAITALIDVIERENAALIRGDRDDVRLLAEEKRLACRDYEEAAHQPATGTDAAKREPMRGALHRLAEVSAENRRRLAAALAAHHRLIQLVAEAVRAQQPAAGGYARGGAPAARARLSAAPPALTFDRAT